jgi:RNA binding motif
MTMAETGNAPAAATEKKTLEIADDVRSGLKERFKFFFSNANLRQDIFMRKLLLHENGVPIVALLRFKTIAKHTKDKEVIRQVASEIEDLVVSNDEQMIRRKVPFTWDMMQEHLPLTLYVSNLPVIKNRYDVTTDQFKQLFDNFPGLVLVKLCMKHLFSEGEKRTKESKPDKQIAHGSALVEFDTVEHLQEAADQLLTIKDGAEVEPKVKLELKGLTLKVETLQEHDARKTAEKALKNDEEKALKNDEEKALKNDEEKALKNDEEKSEEKPKAKDKNEKRKQPSIEPYVFDWKPKCVIKIAELAGSCDREAITEAICEALKIEVEDFKGKHIYVDFSRGQSNGAIRFLDPSDEIGIIIQKLLSGEVLVAGVKVKAELMEGDAENEYWKNFIDFKTKQLTQRAQERLGRKKRKR